MCSSSALDPAPAPADPPAKPLELLEREICELSAHITVGMCQWLLLIAEFDEREGWADWGVHSCAHWLSWRCSIALRAAREHVRVARALEPLPLVIKAFAAGELSYSKVRALTRVVTPANEEYLLMLARHATGAQLERIVAAYRGVLAATTDGADEAHRRRYLFYTYDQDGSLLIQARVPAEDGALVLAALEHAERAAHTDEPVRAQPSGEDGSAEPHDPWNPPSDDSGPDGYAEPPSIATRRADALVALARAQLAADPTEHAAGDPVEVTVHVDVESLTSDELHERCQIADGPSIAPETARRLGCDAAVVRIVERYGRPLSVGRRTRSIPPALKRVLRDRDPSCRFPGCSHRRYLHAHHIQHWARGGPTDLDNLVQLCPQHHRLVHEGGFAVQRAGPDRLRFLRPDGRTIPDRPAPPTRFGPGLEQQHKAQGVSVNDETSRALSAGERLDYGMAIDGLLQEDQRDQPPPPAEPPPPPTGPC